MSELFIKILLYYFLKFNMGHMKKNTFRTTDPHFITSFSTGLNHTLFPLLYIIRFCVQDMPVRYRTQTGIAQAGTLQIYLTYFPVFNLTFVPVFRET